ncbi:glycosyltransferase [Hymenobacter aerilatus]|uniref:Glycosyltransferase n=1 Tax=Hymenobacter aerilatus TaxID=2932251 RepID=A0A8T9SUK7_9BACT|nr:glycosyltransferase [Hymenobacter aerilatus]UOR04413.1 glycosyltransferase [Hymenobacter aerilatus]
MDNHTFLSEHNNDRIPSHPPRIAPVSSEVKRFQWSVMIPVYNCIDYLPHTINSVLAQDMGQDAMQIEVIDDCSSDGNVEELVYQLSKGRIKYYRHSKNVGSLRNFETCITRAQGNWVHILHGDDVIKPNFYQEIHSLFTLFPEAGAAFTNSHFIDEKGEVLCDKVPLSKEPRILTDFLFDNAKYQHLDPPCIVVKRKVYEQIGSFYAVQYGEDWEMWTRIAANFPVAYSPKCLAAYRALQNENITSKAFASCRNITDTIKVIDIIQSYLPDDKKHECKQVALDRASIYIAHMANSIYLNDKHTAFLQLKGALGISRNSKTIYLAAKLYFKHIINYRFINKHIINKKKVAHKLRILKHTFFNKATSL